MKQVLQGATALLVVVLGLFALADAYQAGFSYATAVLSVTAAVVALITLFTATDADRLHRQLDAIHKEVEGIRQTCSQGEQVAGERTPQVHASRQGGRPRVATAGLVGLVVVLAFAQWVRGLLNRRGSKWLGR